MPSGRPSKSKRSPFGERLYTLRLEAGFSQKQLADKLGITQQSYAAWERRSIALKPDQLAELASLLKVSTDALLGHENGNGHVKPKGGPSGHTRQVFEKVSKLPRYQQKKVIEVVEALVDRQSRSS